jgi:tetratricopeptide (TPR) repeat protein
MEGYYFMRADFAKAREFAEQVAAMEQAQPLEMRTLQADWAIANILMHQGEMESAVARMDQCLQKYDRVRHHSGAVQDPGVMCLCYSAWGVWELGYPDEAMKRANEVIALAHALDHKFSIGEAYGFCTAVHFFRERRYQKVTIHVYSFNEPSLRLHERLGFQQEGRLRRMFLLDGVWVDDVIFGMTAEEFEELHAVSLA